MTKHLHLITNSSLTKNMTSMRNCQRMGNFNGSRIGEGGGGISEKIQRRKGM